LFLVILLAAIEVVGATNKEGVGAVLTGVHPAFWFAFLALLAVYYAFLTASVHMIEEVNQLDWLGFDNLNVDQAMDDVVGKYAEDVGFWKNRVRGGGLG
jgi:hypothetical protein